MKHKDEARTLNQCQNCEGYGIIEGRFCECSIGQMALSMTKHNFETPRTNNELRLAIEQDAAYYFSEIRKFQPLDLDHLSLENWKDFIIWRESREVKP